MRIFRTVDIIFALLMIVAAGLTYKVKYAAQRREKEIHKIEVAVATERNNIKQLRSNWARLTQPERIAKLAQYYQKSLNLEIIQPEQILSMKEVLGRLPARQNKKDIIRLEDDEKALNAENSQNNLSKE